MGLSIFYEFFVPLDHLFGLASLVNYRIIELRSSAPFVGGANDTEVPITIGSNIASLQAQRRLSEATTRLGGVFERLSSGQRINRASDDSAGLAIADSLRSSARVQTQAIRNTNDGISALNIMTGTLDQQSSLLMRLSELAEQSANGTYSYAQRSAMQKEYSQLVREFGRIGDTTSFNSLALLRAGVNGNSTSFNLQVGSDGSINSLLSLSGGRSGSLMGSMLANSLDTDIGYGTIDDISGEAGGSVIRTSMKDSSGVSHDIFIVLNGGVNGGPVNFRVLGYANEFLDPTENSDMLTEIGDFSTGINTSTGYLTGSLSGSTSYQPLNGSSASLNIDMSGVQMVKYLGSQVVPVGTNSLIETSGVETQVQSRYALETVRNRLDSLNSLRGTLGAVQSRLNTAKTLTEVTRENFLSAESRIRDADIAEESAALVASQITQQAATKVLQSANLQPQIALKLLQTQ